MSRIVSVTGSVNTTTVSITVNGAPGGAGNALAYMAGSISATLVNTSATAGFEYKVNSGAWKFVGRNAGAQVAVNFAVDKMYFRQTAGDLSLTSVEINVDSVPSIYAAVGDAVLEIVIGPAEVLKATGDVDGITDDANIEAASAALRVTGGGTLDLTEGTYYVGRGGFNGGQQLARLVPSNTRIKGAGIGKTIIKYVWDGIPTNIQSNILNLTRLTDVQIEGVTFDYDFPMDPRMQAYSNENDSYWNCVRVEDSNNVRFIDCEFKGASYHGIIGVGNCSNIDVIGCVFHDNGSRACHFHSESSSSNNTSRFIRNTVYRNGLGSAYAYNCVGSMAAGSNVLAIPNADFAALSAAWPYVGTSVTAIVKGAGYQGGDLIASMASNNGVNTLTFVAGQIASLDAVNVPVSFSNVTNTGVFFTFGAGDTIIMDNFIYDENGAGINIATGQSPNRNLVNTSKGNVSASNASKMWFSRDVQASGVMSFFNGQPTNGQTIIINGTTITFVTSGATGPQVNIGANLAATLTNLQALLAGGTVIALATMTSFVTASQLYLIAGSSFLNTAGNALTMGAGTYVASLSAATLTGGATGDYTKIKAAVTAAGQNNIRVKVDRAAKNSNYVDILGSTLTLNDSENSIAFGANTFEIGTDYNVMFMTIVGSGGNLTYQSNKLIVKNNIVSGCWIGIGGAAANIEMDNIVVDSKLYGYEIGSGGPFNIKGEVLRSGVSNVRYNPGANIALAGLTIDALLDTSGGPNIHINTSGAALLARNIKVSPTARVLNGGSNPNFSTSANLLGAGLYGGLAVTMNAGSTCKDIDVSGATFAGNKGGAVRVGGCAGFKAIGTSFFDNGSNLAASNTSDIAAVGGCSDVIITHTVHKNIDNVANNQLVFSTDAGGVAGLTIASTTFGYNRTGSGNAVIQAGANTTAFRHYDNQPTVAGYTSYLSGPVYPAANKVTQATSRSTGVTMSALTGQITGNSTSLAGLASATFTVTNALVELNDVVNVSVQSGAPANTKFNVSAVAAGSFQITIYNSDPVTADTSVPILNFTVHKAFSALAA